jgi:uncharacterized protein YjbI with pentapeptide repeats
MVCRALHVSLVLFLSSCFCSAQDTNWRWTDKSGHARTKAELEEILHKHSDWLDSDGKKGVRADLSRANLKGADLEGVDLTKALLSGANFEEANLKSSTMAGADLRDAVFIKPARQSASPTSLRRHVGAVSYLVVRGSFGASCSTGVGHMIGGADLEEANIIQADLSRASLRGIRLAFSNLNGARLQSADLGAADLSHAQLIGATLREASLQLTTFEYASIKDTDLEGANITGADLCGAIFEPKSLPSAVRELASIWGLAYVTYESSPDALVQLRKQLRDGGFEGPEREVTYAIKRRQAEILRNDCSLRALGSCFEYGFNKVFFDFTCQYGTRPGNSLVLCFRLWLICAVLYYYFISYPGASGLYRLHFETPELKPDPSEHLAVQAIKPSEIIERAHLRRVWAILRQEIRLFGTAMFFSLMSAFNIGFRDINFGRWLRLLTRKEFDIKATGWARVIAGWQSLISVLLIALFLLTFFGRPFG